MREFENPLRTAGDLMSRDVETIHAEMPLKDAALRLARCGMHGAPVVDDTGRCVGVLSVSDVARWASSLGRPRVLLPRTCAFQENSREPGGRETTLCRLPEGACPFQHRREMPDGRSSVVCGEPHCVPTDWQMVEVESLSGETVREFMTTTVVSAEPDTPVLELARLMLDRGVHRLVVLDPSGVPVGVVTMNDLLQVLAHPRFTAAQQ